MDENKNAIVTWIGNETTSISQQNLHLYQALYQKGAWNSPSTNSQFSGIQNGGNVYYATTANYRNSHAFITWQQKESAQASSTFRLYGASYYHNDFLDVWNFPQKDEYLSEPMHLPVDYLRQISQIDDSNNKLIVWQSADSNNIMHIYKASYCTTDNMWHTPHSEQDFIDTAYLPFPSGQFDSLFKQFDMAMNRNGFAIIAWHQTDSNQNNIYTMRYYLDSCTGEISDNTKPINTVSGEDVLMPQVAINDNGEAALIWTQTYRDKQRLYLATYQNAAWHRPDIVDYISSDDGNVSQYVKDVAINNAGVVTVVWVESKDANHSKLYQKEITLP
jgi:hypothetical protein